MQTKEKAIAGDRIYTSDICKQPIRSKSAELNLLKCDLENGSKVMEYKHRK